VPSAVDMAGGPPSSDQLEDEEDIGGSAPTTKPFHWQWTPILPSLTYAPTARSKTADNDNGDDEEKETSGPITEVRQYMCLYGGKC